MWGKEKVELSLSSEVPIAWRFVGVRVASVKEVLPILKRARICGVRAPKHRFTVLNERICSNDRAWALLDLDQDRSRTARFSSDAEVRRNDRSPCRVLELPNTLRTDREKDMEALLAPSSAWSAARWSSGGSPWRKDIRVGVNDSAQSAFL